MRQPGSLGFATVVTTPTFITRAHLAVPVTVRAVEECPQRCSLHTVLYCTAREHSYCMCPASGYVTCWDWHHPRLQNEQFPTHFRSRGTRSQRQPVANSHHGELLYSHSPTSFDVIVLHVLALIVGRLSPLVKTLFMTSNLLF